MLVEGATVLVFLALPSLISPAVDLVIAHKTNSVYGRTTSWASFERMIELLFQAKGVEMTGPYPWG